MLYTHNTYTYTNISGRTYWQTSMNERTHFFIKIYLSHFVLETLMFLVCERWVGDGDRLRQSSSDHSSTSFASWLGCSTMGHWGPKPSVWIWFSLRKHPISNWLKPSVSLLYFSLTTTVFRLFTLVHLLIDGSIEGQYVTLSS